MSQGYNTDNGYSEFYPNAAADTFQILGKGVSDNDVSVSYTDVYSTPVTPGLVPMGIRVIQKSYSWNAGRAGLILPLEYTLINISAHVIDSVYLGMFVDPDVGPVSDAAFYLHDYSAYLPQVRTAYAHNSIDAGSTPVGVTVLGVPGNLASLRFVWQWYGFTVPGSNDSVLYAWMAGKPFGIQLIDSNQSPTVPTDTHFMLSFGPLGTMNPGDTLRFAVAIVGGQSVSGGSNSLEVNAQNALVLHNRGYSLPPAMPMPRLEIQGDTAKIRFRLHWGPSLLDPLEVWDDSNHLAGTFPDSSWRRAQPPSGHTMGGRIFGGYRLSRRTDTTAWQLLGEFDLRGDSTAKATVDTAYVDSAILSDTHYYYKLTAFSIPDVAVIQCPLAGGGVVDDTIYALSVESSPVYDTAEFIFAGVRDGNNRLAGDFALSQNYPNPFNPTTTVSYALPGRSVVTITVYDLLGDVVAVVRNAAHMEGGYYTDRIDASQLASGIYFYRIHATRLTNPSSTFDRVPKMVLLK
ncbi:MAG TPA: T9SS type A sorting domain-containing protein [Bacteroidota bacterium]|nr:T9SS type A sorting domain-containing protein [Bacteroidota bacterium]